MKTTTTTTTIIAALTTLDTLLTSVVRWFAGTMRPVQRVAKVAAQPVVVRVVAVAAEPVVVQQPQQQPQAAVVVPLVVLAQPIALPIVAAPVAEPVKAAKPRKAAAKAKAAKPRQRPVVMPSAAQATVAPATVLYRRARRGDRYEVATTPAAGEQLYLRVAAGKRHKYVVAVQ